MILIDTGPLVAISDPKDGDHKACGAALKALKRAPLTTTVPVLTEVFHVLGPATRGSEFIRDLVRAGGAKVWWLDGTTLARAFELMDTYADHPMDLADASLVAAAEALGTRRIFTLDREDFAVYRIRRGHRHYPFDLVPVA